MPCQDHRWIGFGRCWKGAGTDQKCERPNCRRASFALWTDRLPRAIGGPDISWHCSKCASLLSRTAAECPAFADALDRCSRDKPYDGPLGLIVYTDEVTPGNVLEHDNHRKFYSFHLGIWERGGMLTTELVLAFRKGRCCPRTSKTCVDVCQALFGSCSGIISWGRYRFGKPV